MTRTNSPIGAGPLVSAVGNTVLRIDDINRGCNVLSGRPWYFVGNDRYRAGCLMPSQLDT
jgi:hypothetical protein